MQSVQIPKAYWGPCPQCGDGPRIVKACIRCGKNRACIECATAGWAETQNILFSPKAPVMLEFVCPECARHCDRCGRLCPGPDGYLHEACVLDDDGKTMLCMECYNGGS